MTTTNVELVPTPDTNEIIEQPVVEPVVEAVVESVIPEPVPVFTYEYQAADDFGRPLGAKQVFKGTNAQEVLDKVAEANKNLIRLNRELNRKIRLGEIEEDEIPQDAIRANVDDLSFESKNLTPEERAQLSRDILDSEKFDSATDRLFEAKLGRKPQQLREALSRNQQELNQLKAEREAEAFVVNNPDYLVCKENFLTLTNWMVKNGLAPIRQNFQLAHDRLKAVGLLLEAPILREETPAPPVPNPVVPESTQVNSQPVEQQPSRITSEEVAPQPQRPVVRPPSGLTRNVASNEGVQPMRQQLTLEDIERMPSAEYKRRLNDPAFRKLADEILLKGGKQ